MTNSNANNGVNSELNVIENAKVANVKYLYYHPGSKGFIDNAGAIVSVVVTKVSVDLRDQVVTTILKDANGNEYERVGEFFLYDSADEFEKDIKSSISKRFRISAGELLQWAGGDKTACCDTPIIDYDEEKGTSNTYLVVWTCINGQALLTPLVIDSVTWDENGKHIEGGTMPDDYWSSKADAYKWNGYKLIDEDGDEFVEQSAEIRLAPTSTQKDIIDTLKKSFKTAAAAGLIVFVNSDGLLQVFNSENVVSNTKDADKSMLCGDTVCLANVELSNVDVKLPVNAGGVSILLKPTERQLKAYKKAHPDT